MRNGVVESISMRNISKSIDKIVLLRKKYDSYSELIKIDEKIFLQFNKRFKICYVYVNGRRAIKYNYGYIASLVNGGLSGITLGLLKSYISFVTEDQSIMNKEFIQKIEKRLEQAVLQIEEQMKNESKKQWKI